LGAFNTICIVDYMTAAVTQTGKRKLEENYILVYTKCQPKIPKPRPMSSSTGRIVRSFTNGL